MKRGRGFSQPQALTLPERERETGGRGHASHPGRQEGAWLASPGEKRRMSGPNGEPHLSLGQEEEAEEGEGEGEGFGEAEYASINAMLDQINACLDHLEEKNDHLHARLRELLESNRQARREFQQQPSGGSSDGSDGAQGAPGPPAHSS